MPLRPQRRALPRWRCRSRPGPDTGARARQPVAAHRRAHLRVRRVRFARRGAAAVARRFHVRGSPGEPAGRRGGARAVQRTNRSARTSWCRPAGSRLTARPRRSRSRTTSGPPTGSDCSSSRPPRRCGGRTRAATTGCSTWPRTGFASSAAMRRRPRSCSRSSRPTAQRVAYVRQNDLYVEDVAGGAIVAPHARRVAHDHQRHVRLGVRGGARAPRWVPLEPRRQVDRVLAARRERREGLRAHRQHGLALLVRRARAVSRRPVARTRPAASGWSPRRAERRGGSRSTATPATSIWRGWTGRASTTRRSC